MADRDPLFDLPDLAAYAEEQSEPAPADQIRARGVQRRRRRHVGVAAATVVAVLLGGGAVFSQTRMLGDQNPDPAPQPSVTAVPSVPSAGEALTAANLATSFDLELQYPKDWVVGETFTGAGSAVVSRCFTAGVDSLQAQTVLSRTYTLDGSTDNTATALALQFGDEASAEAAYRTLEQAVEDCPATLDDAGYQRTELGIDWTDVEVDDGVAERALVGSSVLDRPDAAEGLSEELGLTRVGTRVELVSMVTVGEDYNFSDAEDDPTGLSTYPMIRSLPKVTARLAGSPVAEPAPKRLTDDDLLTAADVPEDLLGDPVSVSDDGDGRTVEALSRCQKESLTSLGATQLLSRNFRQDPKEPGSGPNLYTTTLQFENPGRAMAAERDVASWMQDCRATLEAKDYDVNQPTGDSITSVPVETDVSVGDLYSVAYLEPGADQQDGFFEDVATLVVDDRLVVMVRVHRGSEDFGYYTGEPVDGMLPHPFLAMMKKAATLLS